VGTDDSAEETLSSSEDTLASEEEKVSSEEDVVSSVVMMNMRASYTKEPG
jgi:hypothetical protein